MSETPTIATGSVLPRLPFSKKLRELVSGIHADYPVGDAVIPKVEGPVGTFKPVAPPYFIQYPLWENNVDPDMRFPDSTVEWVYQWSMYGAKGSQLEWMRDRLRALWLGRAEAGEYATEIAVEGMRCYGRRVDADGGMPDPAGASLQSDIRIAFKVTRIAG